MRTPIRNDSYRLINLIFAVVILAVIGYSLYFGGERKHPVPSASKLISGRETISTGLSRSFSAIVRLNFSAAGQLNPYGIRIFIFLLIQLVMRVMGFIFSRHRFRRQMILTDMVASIVMFLIFFQPFFTYFFRF